MRPFHRNSNGANTLLNRWRFLPIAVLSAGVIVLAAVLYLILVGLERDTGQIRAEYRDNVPW